MQLEAVASDTSPIKFYANRVDSEVLYKDERSIVHKVSVNFGVSSFLFDPQHKSDRTRALNGTVEVIENILHVFAIEGFLMYTLDLSSFSQEGKVFSVDILSERMNRFALIVSEPEYTPPTKILEDTDVRPENSLPCGAMNAMYGFPNIVHVCSREAGHLGDHLGFGKEKDDARIWSTGGSRPGVRYGAVTTCVDCGFVWGGSGKAEAHCSSCEYWLRLASSDRPKTAIIANNVHYTLDRSGSAFGGRKSTFIMLDSGKEITSALWYQGQIPERFQHLFKENVKFVGWQPRPTIMK